MSTYPIKDLRNLDINLYNFVASSLSYIDGFTILSGYSVSYVTSGIYVVDGYPNDYTNVKLPSVAIEHERSSDEGFQLGQGKTNIRRFGIDIYARSDAQRDDLGEIIRNHFDRDMTIYDYNIVYENGTYTPVGYASFSKVVMFPFRDSTVKQLLHCMKIGLDTIVHINSGSYLVG